METEVSTIPWLFERSAAECVGIWVRSEALLCTRTLAQCPRLGPLLSIQSATCRRPCRPVSMLKKQDSLPRALSVLGTSQVQQDSRHQWAELGVTHDWQSILFNHGRLNAFEMPSYKPQCKWIMLRTHKTERRCFRIGHFPKAQLCHALGFRPTSTLGRCGQTVTQFLRLRPKPVA